ncbi:hypothetical protein E4634_09630 [Mangrovimicrobium sediminis]|uniref:DUF47 family protein n=1 Tax=Mangrovimicrobium sediminis TaxID=2562682 RepID=A0A4Z0M1Q3_9GAMM|nr:hypothetical protein [Haliea sp. SAOS-164]TGD73288.1 hypothetical protein E4634_09630 [Haliea sp. SAOS-164]
MGFIAKFILPKSVDFNAAIREQTALTRRIVRDLHEACVAGNAQAFDSIRVDAKRAAALKTQNLQLLLDVFLTPYDKESIYRLFTQLDWVVLSTKHFVIEREVYGIESLSDYAAIFALLDSMAELLEDASAQLVGKQLGALANTAERIHDSYDAVVEQCAQAMAQRFQEANALDVLRHHDIVAQLREIAKRIHISANNFEDMAIKVA